VNVTAEVFPLIECAGTPYEMGTQHGAEHRDLVLRSLETFERLLAGLDRPVSTEWATALAMESLADAEAYAPELVEEVRGIADGVGVGFERIFALNASLDLLSVLGARAYCGVPLNCSTYGVTAPATADGETYVGWNADDKEWWLPSCVLIRVRPAEGVPCLLWTFAGFVGRPGINPYLALGANGLCPSDSGQGVPYPFLCRKALAQRSVADAIAAITSARRLSGMNYMLGDGQENIASLEVSADHYAVIEARDGWVAHTNHYLDDSLRVMECVAEESPRYANTRKRQMRWLEMMTEKAGRIGVDDLRAMHGDHANAPDSICRHVVNEGYGMTLTSLICAPGQGRMWVTYGEPCSHPFVAYTI
jgi:isopenicillin-N N-acyltransferase-like protein